MGASFPWHNMEESDDKVTWKHWALLAAALVTATFAGISFAGGDPFALASWRDVTTLLRGLSYSVSVIAILGVHELGHYVQCLKRGVKATPPYFLPGLPIPGIGLIPFIGTFGAFIKMRPTRMRAVDLLAIGAGGPIAGFVVAIPVLVIGIYLSDVRSIPVGAETLTLGDNLLMMMLNHLFHPSIPAGSDVWMHPMAMAGWVGCFLTALNLLPMGQLDGGHIAYAIFGERYKTAGYVVFGAALLLGVFQFPGWIVIALLVRLMGIRHPDLLSDEPTGRSGLAVGLICLVIFVLTFSPAPIKGMALTSLVGW